MSRRLHVFPVAVLAMALLSSAPARGQDNMVGANQEVRIQQLEGKIRTLNGQFEQLNFRLQPLLSHRTRSKSGLVRSSGGTMELRQTIDTRRGTKPWDIIAQCSANSCG
jgi:hypothetical protein